MVETSNVNWKSLSSSSVMS